MLESVAGLQRQQHSTSKPPYPLASDFPLSQQCHLLRNSHGNGEFRFLLLEDAPETTKAAPRKGSPRRRGRMQQVALWDEYLRRRENRWRVWGGAAVLCLFFMVATPKIPHSPGHHIFADMRNFLGVPNTLNVLTSFPLLVIGVIGFVLCLHGHCFGIRWVCVSGVLNSCVSCRWRIFYLVADLWCCGEVSVKGEIWGWTFFYAGVVGLAFGSAYYHLKPDDARVIWERLPVLLTVHMVFCTINPIITLTDTDLTQPLHGALFFCHLSK
ncbi:hypothetical protein Taro_033236 [Colocasia esculenta]|uniref:Uncharacterized protein n=1 Tax=Colocasia esculenta TaxID=4460 RepID=A0A843VNB4_COLES|nr:hypothetical protein [Colocasia esculenta]